MFQGFQWQSSDSPKEENTFVGQHTGKPPPDAGPMSHAPKRQWFKGTNSAKNDPSGTILNDDMDLFVNTVFRNPLINHHYPYQNMSILGVSGISWYIPSSDTLIYPEAY